MVKGETGTLSLDVRTSVDKGVCTHLYIYVHIHFSFGLIFLFEALINVFKEDK